VQVLYFLYTKFENFLRYMPFLPLNIAKLSALKNTSFFGSLCMTSEIVKKLVYVNDGL